MPDRFAPGRFIEPHRFLTKSSVSVIPGMLEAGGFSMVVSVMGFNQSVSDNFYHS
jgi:hypothetical protein